MIQMLHLIILMHRILDRKIAISPADQLRSINRQLIGENKASNNFYYNRENKYYFIQISIKLITNVKSFLL